MVIPSVDVLGVTADVLGVAADVFGVSALSSVTNGTFKSNIHLPVDLGKAAETKLAR